MSLPFPLTLTDRFAWIIRELHAAVAARIRFPPVTGAIILFICARLRKFAVEFEALAARIRTGKYVEQRTRRLGGRRRVAPRSSLSPIQMHYELGLPPWQPGWLHRIAPNHAGVWAAALRTLFSDPEMAALIAAVPRMRRILRPLCFMLGLEASLLKPAPRSRSAADETAEKADPLAVAPAAAATLNHVPTVETVAAPSPARDDLAKAGAIFGLA